MNPRYIQTFSRHRLLLCTPIALAVLISAWFVLGAPKSYQSTASLWLDNPPPDLTSVANTNPAILPPANQEQSVLNELLATRTFRLAVGHAGPMADYLAHHGTAGWSPTALLAQLRATPSLDDRVASALGHVSSTVAGPQVLQVSLQGPTPAVAAGTLKALLIEFNQDRSSTRRTRAQATMAYYQGQLQAAQKAFLGAQQTLTSYRAAHPGATPGQDASLKALVQAEKAASQHLIDARNGLDQASIDAASPLSSAAAFRVLDKPSAPTGPVGGKKKAIMAIFAGLFVGGIISLLGTVGLTALEGDAGQAPARRREPRVPRSPGDRRRPRIAFASSSSSSAPSNGRAPATAETVDLEPETHLEVGENGAVRGTIIAVRDDGQGRRTRPVWTVRSLFPNAAPVGPGNRVAVLGTPGRTGLIRDAHDSGDERLFEVEITNRKLGVKGESGQLSIRPSDGQWIGAEVAFAPIANGMYPDPILEAVPENGHARSQNGTGGEADDEAGPPESDAE